MGVMDVLVLCGTCGMVDGRTGAGAGLACPRCGSRAVETVELSPERPGRRRRLIELDWVSEPILTETGVGACVPVLRDAAA